MISPTKVGAQSLRHQLRVKTRSMSGFSFINYGLKSAAWLAFGCVTNYGLKPAAWKGDFDF